MKRISFVVGLVCTSLSAQALIIDTYPDWQGQITSGWMGQAQAFIGPNTDVVLNSWRFSMSEGSGNVTFGIFDWGAAGPIGAPLFSRTVAWPSSSGPVDINNINLTLTPGASYGAVIDLQGQLSSSVYYNTNQNSYSGGFGWWWDGVGWNGIAGYNQTFRAEFSPVPEPATLLVFGSAALLAFRRRKR